MISANTRASSTRSRFSSPQQGTAASSDTTKANGTESSKRFMEKWLEPPVQSKASYQEAGLIRHGVVENMAPLGTLPKAAASRKGHGQDAPHRPRIIFKKREPAAQPAETPAPPQKPEAPEISAPEVEPEADTNFVDSDSSGQVAEPVSPKQTPTARRSAMSKDDDADYEPKPVSSSRVKINLRKTHARQSSGPAQTSAISTPTNKAQQGSCNAGIGNSNGSTPVAQGSNSNTSNGISSFAPIGNGASTSNAKTSNSMPEPQAAIPLNPELVFRVGEVVKIAVREALSHFRYSTAWALRTIYDENMTNMHIMDVMDQIFAQTASPEMAAEFVQLVYEKKAEGGDDNRACYFFVQPPTNSRPPPHKPMAAPYRHLVTLKVPSPVFEEAATSEIADREQEDQQEDAADAHINKKRKVVKDTTPPDTTPKATTAAAAAAAAAATGASASRNKKSKSPKGKTPTKNAGAAAAMNGGLSAVATPSSRKSKRVSTPDSTSSLSSAPSSLAEDEDEDEVFGGKQPGASSPSAPSAAQSSPLAGRRTRVAGRASAAATARLLAATGSSPSQSAHASIADGVLSANRAGTAGAAGAGNTGVADAESTSKTRAVASQPIKTTRRSAALGKRTGKASPTPTPTPTPTATLTPNFASPNSPPSSNTSSSNANHAAAADAAASTTESHTGAVKSKSTRSAAPAPAPVAVRRGARNREPKDKDASANHNNNNRSLSPAGPTTDFAVASFPSRFPAVSEEDPDLKLRREARKITTSLDNNPESSARLEAVVSTLQQHHHHQGAAASSVAGAVDVAASAPVAANNMAAATTPSSGVQLRRPRAAHQQAQQALRSSTRSARKRSHEELEDDSVSVTAAAATAAAVAASPTPSSFPVLNVPTPSSAVDSRASTPIPGARPAKKARTGLRVKNSPMKRKTGPSAGMPRPSGERSSPAPNGASNNGDENDDYCASCGGNGELVCCETCSRSFHFRCVDPPLRPPNLPDEWFCNVCLTERGVVGGALTSRRGGPLRHLMHDLDTKNSSAFRLPLDVKDFFVGVRTGPDGEYEDIPQPTSKTRKRGAGFEELPDFFRIRDPDNKVTICHMCKQSAEFNRAIIPCSVCGLWWHLDCLDPPMANPPVLRLWKCPAHVDDVLAAMPSVLAPAHRYRQVKDSVPIEQAYSRGLRNNGYIEIVDDDFPTDEDGDVDLDADPRLSDYSRPYKLPADGIILDFVSRVNRDNKATTRAIERGTFTTCQAALAPVEAPEAVQAIQPAPSGLADPRFIDQALAAHNLASFASASANNNSAASDNDNVQMLIDALMAGADDNVVSLMARSNAMTVQSDAPLTQDDKVGLKAMLARMKQVAAELEQRINADDGTASATATLVHAPSSPVDSPGAAVPQLTEGTEKSTPEAEDIPVVTPATEPEAPASPPAKETLPCDDEDVEMTDDPTAENETISTAVPQAQQQQPIVSSLGPIVAAPRPMASPLSDSGATKTEPQRPNTPPSSSNDIAAEEKTTPTTTTTTNALPQPSTTTSSTTAVIGGVGNEIMPTPSTSPSGETRLDSSENTTSSIV